MSLLTTIEPSELEKGFVSAEDRKIIAEDKPERFQVLRFDCKNVILFEAKIVKEGKS